MKTRLKFIILGIVAGLFASCAFDNYDEPGSFLEGRIVYNGEPISVSSKDVSFQLWEPGWQKSYSINVEIAQDGSYSTLLFDANYKLVFPSNQGPWRSKKNAETGSDTILVNISGNKTLDIEVEPYYMIRNANFSASGRNVTANFKVEQIIKDSGAKGIERINFYVNKTQFVDFRSSSNVAKAEISGGNITDVNAISMSLTVPVLTPTQNYIFARVGVKIQGVEDMIFSPVQKIDL